MNNMVQVSASDVFCVGFLIGFLLAIAGAFLFNFLNKQFDNIGK